MKKDFLKMMLAATIATAFVACHEDDNDSVKFDTNEYSVDLGLPSKTRWAKMNVGASNPWDYGDYFAWGETKSKESYDWSNYLHIASGGTDWQSINKYQSDDHEPSDWNKGTFIGDGKTTLESADDAASANWGGDWAMPTVADFEELIEKCETDWTDNYNNTGKPGLVVSGNGNSIFLPAAGFYQGGSFYDSVGWYWSASLGEKTFDAQTFNFYSNGQEINSCNRCHGCSVRPVCQKNGSTQGHDAVDLGLPSGKLWATCNVGANTPAENGGFFAWGETTAKTDAFDFYWIDYKHIAEKKEEVSVINKYQIADGYFGVWYSSEYSGDGKTMLEPADDAAQANWGGNWTMPTTDQMWELIDECYWVWTADYNGTNVCGYIVYKVKNKADKGVKVYANETPSGNYSLTDTHIFLPAAGEYSPALHWDSGWGFYWGKSHEHNFTSSAGEICFSNKDVGMIGGFRCDGGSVRPVCKH